MTDNEVVIKGEIHTSRGDHTRERELLLEGTDCLVLEGSREEAEYGLFQQWYAFAMLLTRYLFFHPLYTDSSVLEDIAEAQGSDVVKTRESNASILENSHVLARIAAALLFLVLFFASALFAIGGVHFYGASSLILSVMLPPLLLRIHESTRSTGSRNEKMAEQITEAAEEGGRVVAVIGNDHADSVCEHLPEWVDPVREDPIYSRFSSDHASDIAYPLFVSFSVLWVFYSLFAAYAEAAWMLS